jgi:hypothetical protein
MREVGLGLLMAVVLAACPKSEARLTVGEAQQALEESAAASQAEGLTAASVDISTSFTIGAGVERARDELVAFLLEALPCAEVTVEGASLSIEYGARAGSCSYRGHELAGVAHVTISRNDESEVLVEHEWIELSNGLVTLSGTAEVRWNLQARTRHVVHHTFWTSLRTGRQVEGEGDRVQSVLEGGLAEGISVDGSRSWTGERGRWDLAIDGVEMRWADPVPQAGTYTLSTPFDKVVSMSFDRADEDTIRVTVASGQRDFAFNVSKLGVVSRDAR